MENLRLKIVFSQIQLFVKLFILTCFVPFIQSNLSNPKACQYVPFIHSKTHICGYLGRENKVWENTVVLWNT